MVKTVGPLSIRAAADPDLAHLAAGRRGALQHGDREPRGGERQRRRQSGDPGADITTLDPPQCAGCAFGIE